LSETLVILRGIQPDIVISALRSSCEVFRYSYQISIKLDFSLQTLEKYPCIKFHENPSSWSLVVPF